MGMIVTVKNEIWKKLFVDETDRVLAILRSQKLFGSEKAVVGPDGIVKYETNIENLPGKAAGENRRYMLKQSGVLIATARPVYAADADHFAIPIPPRPVGLSVQMRDGTRWRVVRGEKNTVEIQSPVGTGRLSGFFAIRPLAFEIPDGCNVFLFVGLYALIEYMMHEDDIWIV